MRTGRRFLLATVMESLVNEVDEWMNELDDGRNIVLVAVLVPLILVLKIRCERVALVH